VAVSTLTQTLGNDHGHCDELFAAAEAAVGAGDWDGAQARFEAFRDALERHLDFEESRLFPALEEAEPAALAPTSVMREEHRHMRALVAELDRALGSRDAEAYLGASETLLVLMQQHNAKEEHVLYPMSDRVLGEGAHALARELAPSREAAPENP